MDELNMSGFFCYFYGFMMNFFKLLFVNEVCVFFSGWLVYLLVVCELYIEYLFEVNGVCVFLFLEFILNMFVFLLIELDILWLLMIFILEFDERLCFVFDFVKNFEWFFVCFFFEFFLVFF